MKNRCRAARESGGPEWVPDGCHVSLCDFRRATGWRSRRTDPRPCPPAVRGLHPFPYPRPCLCPGGALPREDARHADSRRIGMPGTSGELAFGALAGYIRAGRIPSTSIFPAHPGGHDITREGVAPHGCLEAQLRETLCPLCASVVLRCVGSSRRSEQHEGRP